SWSNTTASYGTFTPGAGGGYSYTLNPALVQSLKPGQTHTETFGYTMKDADGDQSTATLTITITGSNDAPVVTPVVTSVSEEGLSGGIADDVGNADTTDVVTRSGTISASDADGDTLTYTLGTSATALTSKGQPVTWTGGGTSPL